MTGPARTEDLVALALGQLDDAQTERVKMALDRDAEAKAEADAIGRHLDLHDAVPSLRPEPVLWQRVRARLDEPAADAPAPRSLLVRFWMPLAAAALIVAALITPRLPGERTGSKEEAVLVPLFGDWTAENEHRWTARGVTRVRMADSSYLTLDAGTTLEVRSPTRLALETGRVFFEVDPANGALTVECGAARVTTLGTRFLVECLGGGEAAVHVEQGRVLCEAYGESAEVAAGARWSTGPAPSREPGYATAWFSLPSMDATLIDPTTLRVVITNEMPDPIELAPPTAGEPFFFARYGGHQHHLTVDLRAPVRLEPGASRSFELKLPIPVPDGEAVEVSTKKLGLRTEAAR